MKDMFLIFTAFVIYPLTLSAEESGIDPAVFDELPIEQVEVRKVTSRFWNAKSIQDQVKAELPDQVRSKFTRSANGQGCAVQAVVKTEGSADACELSDDPNKMAKFIYNFNISCNFGNYQVAVCSREESKLLNQIKVINPEKLVSDDNPFDLESTM